MVFHLVVGWGRCRSTCRSAYICSGFTPLDAENLLLLAFGLILHQASSFTPSASASSSVKYTTGSSPSPFFIEVVPAERAGGDYRLRAVRRCVAANRMRALFLRRTPRPQARHSRRSTRCAGRTRPAPRRARERKSSIIGGFSGSSNLHAPCPGAAAGIRSRRRSFCPVRGLTTFSRILSNPTTSRSSSRE